MPAVGGEPPPPGGGPEREDVPPRDPQRVVVAAYLLALTCLLVPLALVGALFAGVALARRGRPLEGAGVVALGVACTALGVAALR